MKVFELKTKKREATGKKDTAKLRKQEMIPCVLYGPGELIHFYAHKNEFKNLIYSPDVFMISLDIDGVKFKSIMKEIQFHPATDEILHIDFFKIEDDKPFAINLPIRLIGTAPGVIKGGRLRNRFRYLNVYGFLADMPDVFEVDISKLEVGQSIKVGSLSHDKLKFLDPVDTQIVAVIVGRAVGTADDEAEEVSDGEGEAEGEGEAAEK